MWFARDVPLRTSDSQNRSVKAKTRSWPKFIVKDTKIQSTNLKEFDAYIV